MIHAALCGDGITITADTQDAIRAARLPSVTRTTKMPPLTWRMPMTFDTAEALRSAGVFASEELAAVLDKLGVTCRYVEKQKLEADAAPLSPMPIQPGIQPYRHQIRTYNIALALMDTIGATALLADMGTGKSMAAIAVMGRLYLNGRIRRVLVVAPSSVCSVWMHELRQYAAIPYAARALLGDREHRLDALRQLEAPATTTSDPLRIAIVNYESTWRLKKELLGYHPDFVLCDESQRIKSHKAQQSKAMHEIGDAAKYRMILTGTPVQNDARDLWSQYRFLAPDIFGRSYYAFEKRYAIIGGYGNHQYLGPRNLEELTRKAHSIAYRVTKAQCLDLPEKMFEERIVDLEPSARELYRRIQKESFAELENGGEVTANIVLTRLLRLQQITGGFLTDDAGNTQPVSTAKLDAAADIIRSLCIDEGKKLVIFARFRAEVNALMLLVDKLLGSKLRSVAIHGDIPIPKRGGIVEQFQGDPDTRLLVGQIDACAEGITLTAAETILYYSVNWNYAKYQQSQDRIHRIGQRNTCLYLHLVVPGTVDHRIMAALRKKENLAASVVDNWRMLLGEEESR